VHLTFEAPEQKRQRDRHQDKGRALTNLMATGVLESSLEPDTKASVWKQMRGGEEMLNGG
jgi:hypothetical protein